MSNKRLSEDELRHWVLSLPPDSIRSLEDTLKSIRDCHFSSLEGNVNKMDDRKSLISDQVDVMDDIDVSPPSRTMSPTSSNISLQSRSKSGKTYENGRRNLKEEDVSTEEANKRSKRRERNRLAAAKCRKRRQDKIETLQNHINQLKLEMDELNANIDHYNSEQEKLSDIINCHKCNLQVQSSSLSSRPKDLKIDKSPELASPSNNVFICSLSPQLINLSPLFTPSTMKLLIDSINQHSESSNTPTIKEESQQNITSDSTFFTAISTTASNFSQSLNLLNLLSPTSDLLNMNILSWPSLKLERSSKTTSSHMDLNPPDPLESIDQS